MKNTSLLLGIILSMAFMACENQDWEFEDYDYTAVYFPYQYPVRTLVLGDYVFDNENDNNLKFMISPRVGGMYENRTNWAVEFELDESLVQNLVTPSGEPVRVLPQQYYTLNPTSEITIPKGEFYAGIEVQLTEEFLNDPLAIGFNYVIPLRIVGTSADSILAGSATTENPDPRIAGDWLVTPKDFTLFGIKYVNPYHGKYLRRGQLVIEDLTGNEVETIVYRSRYVEDDEVWGLKTVNRNGVIVGGPLRSGAGSPGNFEILLTFDESGNCLVTETENSDFPVAGSGRYVKDSEEWGNKERDAIYLNFEVSDGSYTYTHQDTLVFRDKDVRFEEFNPVVQ